MKESPGRGLYLCNFHNPEDPYLKPPYVSQVLCVELKKFLTFILLPFSILYDLYLGFFGSQYLT